MSSSKNLDYEKTSFLHKANTSFIEEMYVKFIEGDTTIPQSWKSYFEGLGEDLKDVIKEIEGPNWKPNKIKINLNQQNLKENRKVNQINIKDSIKAIALIRAYRINGHLIANLEPLGMMERKYMHELHPEDYGFNKNDFNRKIYLDNYLDRDFASLKEIIKFLKDKYCSSIGVEYMHMTEREEKIWFRERMEKEENKISFTNNGKKAILNKLIQAEGFEKYLALKFIGTKRFGLDGAESLIPALEQIIKRGGQLGVKEIKIGMPHRGRLLSLIHI